MVYTSSVKSSYVKPKQYLGSLDISKATPIGLNEDFSRSSATISDCRAFSLFETVTGSLTNG